MRHFGFRFPKATLAFIPMAEAQDHYAVLQVSRFATQEAIRVAYHAQMMRHHPDHNVGREAQAERHSIIIGEAFRVLSDPAQRAGYDAELALVRLRILPNRPNSGKTTRQVSARASYRAADKGSGKGDVPDRQRPRRAIWRKVAGALTVAAITLVVALTLALLDIGARRLGTIAEAPVVAAPAVQEPDARGPLRPLFDSQPHPASEAVRGSGQAIVGSAPVSESVAETSCGRDAADLSSAEAHAVAPDDVVKERLLDLYSKTPSRSDSLLGGRGVTDAARASPACAGSPDPPNRPNW